MKIRTLISNQTYFGLEPLAFRRGAELALARVAKLPPEQARLKGEILAKDFRVDSAHAQKLLDTFVAKGLLQIDRSGGTIGEYRLTDLFKEYALARVAPPLTRVRAKELLDEACTLATRINADWKHNPLIIHMLAVSGSYMSRNNRISDVTLWPVVKRRREVTTRRFGSSVTKADGAAEIAKALRALSPHVVVHVVADRTTIERPFAVPFRDLGEGMKSPTSSGRFWDWGFSFRRQLIGR
jgi:hypothetical protein